MRGGLKREVGEKIGEGAFGRAVNVRDRMAVVATAESAYTRISEIRDAPRHSALVRVTHWINTLSFIGLLVSGIAILLAHPRFYWGETGAVGNASLFVWPLPFMTGG